MGAAAIPLVAAVITAVGTGVEINQQRKAQEGASNAASEQQKQLNQQLNEQKKKDTENVNQKQTQAGASQKAAIDAIRASMSASAGSGGTILTGPQGAGVAPTAGKTLLGI